MSQNKVHGYLKKYKIYTNKVKSTGRQVNRKKKEKDIEWGE